MHFAALSIVLSNFWVYTFDVRNERFKTHESLAVHTSRKHKPLLLKITPQTVACHGPTDMPEGCWQKGATTTLLCAFWHGFSNGFLNWKPSPVKPSPSLFSFKFCGGAGMAGMANGAK